MREYSDIFVFIVVVVAFIAGYSVVSFLIRYLKELKNRPNLNEEIWRQQAGAEETKRRRQEGDRDQGSKSRCQEHDKGNRQTGRQAEHEKREHNEEQTGWKWGDATRSRTFKDERHFESVLGLPTGFTPGDVKRRYRELAAQYHPDKVVHLGPKLREAADEEMKKINEAYDFFKRKYGLP